MGVSPKVAIGDFSSLSRILGRTEGNDSDDMDGPVCDENEDEDDESGDEFEQGMEDQEEEEEMEEDEEEDVDG